MPDRGVQRYTCHTYLRRSEESTGIFPNPFVIHRPSRRRDCCTRLRRTTWGTIDSRGQNAHACRSRTLDLQNSSRMCTHHFRPNRPSTFRSPNKSLRKMVTQTPLQQCRSKHFAGTSNSGCPKIPQARDGQNSRSAFSGFVPTAKRDKSPYSQFSCRTQTDCYRGGAWDLSSAASFLPNHHTLF